ncbi:Na(+)/H(+) antiporter NhaD [Mariniflexile rhizosphaerae]|uniref:sodium:proton antiporter NhaD n=1 Tax=unclassified Mariniflexile TaxID=2643887 RepID=UPI000CC1DB1F|nr:sodium:proton antiporter NhaD [Mariniflexile sp. TRM1-10]AXP82992.1 Na(+)/H(+) antiporter NhaD [Mariniflexile sp. TRM1-10]PLB19665.1 MAG: Na+/H+ antiporter NhaD type [Flavobacteriaceae bacterium FS1-H7996/R]
MYILLAITFIIGYIFIAFEHPFKIDKAASAILTGVLCWVILVLGQDSIFQTTPEPHFIDESILHHLGEISQILFFLLGAMTIVELIDTHGGFHIITEKIKTTNRIKLLWIIGCVTFVLSSVLDNLTTTIVMATLLKKLMKDKEDIWFFGGIVVIAANAGGAWSPIGDVTTIMLWIGGQVTAINIIKEVLLPSIICLIVPLIVLSFIKKGTITKTASLGYEGTHAPITSSFEASLILWLGVAGLLFVPVFKTLTHLPPFMGILLSLGVLWVVTEIIHKNKTTEHRHNLSVAHVVRKIDTPSVLFFLGILLAVASLQTGGHLAEVAKLLSDTFGNIYIINIIIGFMSSIVDNVPLVAGAMGMYPLSLYPQDHEFWELLAFCAGTGGSTLIIGSAAGVAIMGILKIDFLWYLKKISWLAVIGYLAGVLTYYLLNL